MAVLCSMGINMQQMDNPWDVLAGMTHRGFFLKWMPYESSAIEFTFTLRERQGNREQTEITVTASTIRTHQGRSQLHAATRRLSVRVWRQLSSTGDRKSTNETYISEIIFNFKCFWIGIILVTPNQRKWMTATLHSVFAIDICGIHNVARKASPTRNIAILPNRKSKKHHSMWASTCMPAIVLLFLKCFSSCSLSRAVFSRIAAIINTIWFAMNDSICICSRTQCGGWKLSYECHRCVKSEIFAETCRIVPWNECR